MSRIGSAPVEIPAGVEAKINEKTFEAKGSKGTLSYTFDKNIEVKINENQITVERKSDAKEHRALHGLTRSLINNIIEGVSKGFEKDLELVGVGYRANKKGNGLEINVGYSKPVNYPAVNGIEFELSAPTKLKIKGIDKQLVGQVAAEIRSIRPPEPYKGKGIKYTDEHIRRKAGKAAKV